MRAAATGLIFRQVWGGVVGGRLCPELPKHERYARNPRKLADRLGADRRTSKVLGAREGFASSEPLRMHLG